MNRLSKYFLAAAALLGLAACSENAILTDFSADGSEQKGAIQFGYNLPMGGTRTVLTAKTGFPIGSAMAVDGFQMTEAGETLRLFSDDKVTKKDDANWTYENTRYWDIASTYVFYAMYPYSVAHAFDATSRFYTINNYTVSADKTKQEDVMIAEEKKAMPENLVTFNFNHLLSQINFYLKASSDFNTKGIESIELKSFDLVGVKSTGSFVQTGWNAKNGNVQGNWTVDSNSAEYDMPTVTSAALVTNSNPVSEIETDLLMLPQSLAGVKALVSYRVNYGKGITSSFTTMVSLPSALISKKAVSDNDTNPYVVEWKPNYIYRYNMAVNPSKRTISDYGVDVDGSDNGGDGKPNPDTTIVVDKDGNWWIDEDGDGIGDVPIVWEDIDGDGKEEGGIDRDGDGHIDNVDGENENPDSNPLVTDGDPTNNPDGKDAILVDTDGDGECDTQLERETTYGPDDKPFDQYTVVDWDGSLGGDENQSGDGVSSQVAQIVVDEDGVPVGLKVDTDGDGITDTTYPVAWEDVDGDGKLELGVDRDGDGKIDNVDGENLNNATPGTNTYDNVADGNTLYNPDGKDVILVDTDGDGIADTQIEQTITYHPDPIRNMEIKFSATVEDFENEVDSDILVPAN